MNLKVKAAIEQAKKNAINMMHNAKTSRNTANLIQRVPIKLNTSFD